MPVHVQLHQQKGMISLSPPTICNSAGSCAAPSAKGDDKFITTDYLQQCPQKLVGKMEINAIANDIYFH
uniref:hypothetical protein n=1 Tax=Klebsiella pneumoniae TaxID=573 RepID=UPI001BFFD705|nr:hypothetical protein [Klebsiella pneumoniae]